MRASVTAPPSSREQLRTFHIAGRGLDHAIPTAPLRPAALDQLQQLPPFESDDLTSLYDAAAAPPPAKPRAAFLTKIKQARERLSEFLMLDASYSPEASSPENISASLGREAGAFFNASALAEAFQSSPDGGPPRIDPERRARIETTIATLDSAIEETEQQPPFQSFESSQTALEFCERQLDQFTVVLRALRTRSEEHTSE